MYVKRIRILCWKWYSLVKDSQLNGMKEEKRKDLKSTKRSDRIAKDLRNYGKSIECNELIIIKMEI